MPRIGSRPSQRAARSLIESDSRSIRATGAGLLRPGEPPTTRNLNRWGCRGGFLPFFDDARAIAKRPEVLLCDEPTGALDVTTGITVLEAVERINRELGTLTVIITHNAVMSEMADRVLHLSDGKIIDSTRNEVRLPASGLKW